MMVQSSPSQILRKQGYYRIDPTFQAYKMPGYNNIWNPLHNMLASIRYSVSRYGSLSSAWRGVGYANGGVVSRPELAMVGEGKDTESIIPWNNTKRSLALWLLTGRKIGALDNAKQNDRPLSVQKGKVFNQTSNDRQMNFNVNYGVTIQGNADQQDVEAGMNRGNEDLKQRLRELLTELQQDEARVSF